MDNFKKCSKCGEVKLLDCFSKNKTKKDGYAFWCKKCAAENAKKHYSENIEKIKAIKAKYRSENIEKIKDTHAKYRSENREKINAKNAKYFAENPEKRKAAVAKYRDENPEKAKASYIKWLAKNPEKRKAADAKWRAENPEKVKEFGIKKTRTMPDSYIRNVIRQGGVPNEIITPDLIETKRLHILIQRKLKDLTK